MTNPSLDQFKKHLEKEVLRIIHKLAKEKKASSQRLSNMAKKTLELIEPTQTIEELYKSAVKLDDEFPELAEVVYNLLEEYEKNYSQSAIKIVSELIKQGQYENAENYVKKVLEFKINST